MNVCSVGKSAAYAVLCLKTIGSCVEMTKMMSVHVGSAIQTGNKMGAHNTCLKWVKWKSQRAHAWRTTKTRNKIECGKNVKSEHAERKWNGICAFGYELKPPASTEMDPKWITPRSRSIETELLELILSSTVGCDKNKMKRSNFHLWPYDRSKTIQPECVLSTLCVCARVRVSESSYISVGTKLASKQDSA